jgi:hypothetical protein
MAGDEDVKQQLWLYCHEEPKLEHQPACLPAVWMLPGLLTRKKPHGIAV